MIQEVVVRKTKTIPEHPGKMSTKDTTFALRVKKESGAEIAQDDATVRVENFESETTDTSCPKVYFKVPTT